MATGTHSIRVRYGESDQMGIAHHAAYVTWFEECRIELLRNLGASYRELEERGVLRAFEEGPDVLAEELVVGVECTGGVLEAPDGSLISLPPVESWPLR